MTLKGKNRYTFAISFFLLGMSIFLLAYFLLKLNSVYKGGVFIEQRLSFEKFSPFTQNIWTIIFSGLCMLIYISITGFYVYSHFRKTPATEVIYFMLFLIGCSVELSRVIMPLEIIQDVYPEFLVLLGRTLFWGRVLCFASLFTGAVAGTPDQRINAERNIFIIIAFSLALAYLAPVNTTDVATTYSINIGIDFFTNFIYIIAAALTFITYAIKSWQNEDKKYLLIGLDLILTEAGLALLSITGILVVTLIGAAFLFAGTFSYLKRLHKLYM